VITVVTEQKQSNLALEFSCMIIMPERDDKINVPKVFSS
jgi:hypothetical protein